MIDSSFRNPRSGSLDPFENAARENPFLSDRSDDPPRAAARRSTATLAAPPNAKYAPSGRFQSPDAARSPQSDLLYRPRPLPDPKATPEPQPDPGNLQNDFDRDLDRAFSERSNRDRDLDRAFSERSPAAAAPASLQDWANSTSSAWEQQRRAAQQRVADLKDQQDRILAAERRRIRFELVLLCLALLGVGWAVWRFRDALPPALRLPFANSFEGRTPQPQPTAPPSKRHGKETPVPAGEAGNADDIFMDEDDTRSTVVLGRPPGRFIEGGSGELDGNETATNAPQSLDDSPDDAPLSQVARNSERAVEGLASTLPPDLDNPVGDDWRVGGYRVSDVYLPCQNADRSDCRSTHPVTGFHDVPHWGVDLAMPHGAPLYAVGKEGAKVNVSCRYHAGKGLVATITSDSFPQYEFQALHLSDCIPGVYDAGALVAAVGSTGVSNGPHLHWEARWNGRRIDPPRWSIEFAIKGDIVVDTPPKYVY